MKKSWVSAAAAVVMAVATSSSQAALVEIFDTNVGGAALDSVAEAQAVIAAASSASLSVLSSTVNYSGNTFPGFKMPLGSNRSLMPRIRRSSTGPNITSIKRFWAQPMPCSPLRVPPRDLV